VHAGGRAGRVAGAARMHAVGQGLGRPHVRPGRPGRHIRHRARAPVGALDDRQAQARWRCRLLQTLLAPRPGHRAEQAAAQREQRGRAGLGGRRDRAGVWGLLALALTQQAVLPGAQPQRPRAGWLRCGQRRQARQPPRHLRVAPQCWPALTKAANAPGGRHASDLLAEASGPQSCRASAARSPPHEQVGQQLTLNL
jgi:hypothetical protein